MSEASPRFALPFIMPGQAQKELFHNEALMLTDCLLHPAVEAGPIPAPPPDPEPGQSWLVAAGAEAAWSGRDHCLATWSVSGWRFTAPVPGMAVWKQGDGYSIYWNGSAWSTGEFPVRTIAVGGQQVVGERQPEVPSPSGGTIIDGEARSAITALIVALRSHGLID